VRSSFYGEKRHRFALWSHPGVIRHLMRKQDDQRLDSLNGRSDVVVFHGGTAANENREFITSGGRVLGVTALGSDIKAAKENAYKSLENIHFEGMHYRKDIGDRR